MEKKLLFLFVVLTLRGSPQSNEIDTLYYLHDSTQFITNYLIAGEVFNIHTRFYPNSAWETYRILELHLLLMPPIVGDTIHSISFYKDTLQQLICTQLINKVIDSNDVYPNWFKIIVDNQTSISGYIEVPTWWGMLCEVQPSQFSGNTIGFYDSYQAWGVFQDLPVKLIIERIPVRVENDFKTQLDFKLEQNYPNPFNPSTSIQYAISSRQFVTLKVYNVLGNEVATLVDEYKPAGKYEVKFDASSGMRNLASGIYFYQLKAGDFIQTKKMILLR